MGAVRDLKGHSAVKKIRELGKDLTTCMFCTYADGKLISRPMSVNQIDETGNLWFLSDKDSNKNRQIKKNNSVELIFAEGTNKFMKLSGQAFVTIDENKIKELWTPIAKIWFTEGVRDPSISCIQFSFDDGYYWDSKHGKVVETLKMATALVSGQTMDDAIEGKLVR